MEIVIMSGKGGTGKTSIAAALGVIAGSRVVVVDSDVDASNLFLLYQPQKFREVEFYSGKKALIDAEKCEYCGLCYEKCRFSAIELIGELYKVNDPNCEGCSLCSRICPYGAISMLDNLAGNWYISRNRFQQWFVHAALGIGQGNSGKLVSKVKEEARKIAQEEKIPFVLVDGPPGVGCPAISAISETDLVLIVTEATPSGLHDLKRLVELIKHFKVEAACLINKADLNTLIKEDIEGYCSSVGIPVIGELPFHPVFTEALQLNKTIVEMDFSDINNTIQEVWKTITQGG